MSSPDLRLMSEIDRLRRVVAAQREALERVVDAQGGWAECVEIARAALDAEGVSESGV